MTKLERIAQDLLFKEGLDVQILPHFYGIIGSNKLRMFYFDYKHKNGQHNEKPFNTFIKLDIKNSKISYKQSETKVENLEQLIKDYVIERLSVDGLLRLSSCAADFKEGYELLNSKEHPQQWFKFIEDLLKNPTIYNLKLIEMKGLNPANDLVNNIYQYEPLSDFAKELNKQQFIQIIQHMATKECYFASQVNDDEEQVFILEKPNWTGDFLNDCLLGVKLEGCKPNENHK